MAWDVRLLSLSDFHLLNMCFSPGWFQGEPITGHSFWLGKRVKGKNSHGLQANLIKPGSIVLKSGWLRLKPSYQSSAN